MLLPEALQLLTQPVAFLLLHLTLLHVLFVLRRQRPLQVCEALLGFFVVLVFQGQLSGLELELVLNAVQLDL